MSLTKEDLKEYIGARIDLIKYNLQSLRSDVFCLGMFNEQTEIEFENLDQGLGILSIKFENIVDEYPGDRTLS